MANNLEALETWVAPLLTQLEPRARNQLTRSVGQVLRRSQQQRIAAQRDPDGRLFAPRKKRQLRAKKGRVRRKLAMFRKLRTATYLKVRGDSNAVTVGFTGRVARIARVHQYGLRDRAEQDAPRVEYERRRIIGLGDTDIELIRETLLAALIRQCSYINT